MSNPEAAATEQASEALVTSSQEALDQALRRHLGLEGDDTFRVLEAGPRTVLLERRGGSQPLPGQGNPDLSLDVASFPLHRLFEWEETTNHSGFLLFTDREHVKGVHLHQGEVVFASSNQIVDRLGESLLRAGVLSLDHLREAQRCWTPGVRFGKVLVERGYLSPRELWNGVKFQVEEIVRSLFSYGSGRVRFWIGEFPPDNVVRLSLPIGSLVAEGMQRRDELLRFLAVLEDPRIRLCRLEEAEVDVGPAEHRLLRSIGEGASFEAVCDDLLLDADDAARSIQLLRLVGAVKLVRTDDCDGDFLGAADLSREEDEPLRELTSNLCKLIAELAAPLARADGPEGIAERLSQTLDETAARFPSLLGGLELAEGPSIDPEPLIQRALALPGDREDQVMAALGELVAYLEFEVMNHPEVEDAAGLIASLSGLRPDRTP